MVSFVFNLLSDEIVENIGHIGKIKENIGQA